jgi:carbonic anhydrase
VNVEEKNMTSDPLLQATQSLRADWINKEGERIIRLVREGQKPHAMFIGCCDSRVIPEGIWGARPGDLFVVRNIANIVPPFGTAHESTGAALDYAVNHLRIPHLIICGHTDCGGLKALDGHLDALAEPSLASWLKHARQAQARVDQSGVEPARRSRAISEQNVILQMEHAADYPAVYKALKAGRLELHGWLFDLYGPQVYSYNPKTQSFEAL